ncbi:MAG TPA: DNA polymerase III subunit gamma/tau [Ignavibacteriaceae bacterium]|nr:DNA polymerase III subunit gamma/tau [Ignavibacteriaceae bacterium]
MSFVVTARKYRPQKFDDVVGQEHITTTLKNAVMSGRVAHAYLLTGPRGVGKTTTARILAKAINCLNPSNGEPCNNCAMCLSIQNLQLMDIIEIDAASNRGIDEVRSLRESVKYAPSKGKYKVYIIDEVHMLTKDSFNAFLKTLEEPPAHTVFIFATTDVHRVPSTIISRCQRYDFRRIPLAMIKKLLQEIADSEQIQIDDKTLSIIGKRADGGLRDAESFFDQAVAFCGNKVEYNEVVKIFNLIDEEIYFKISDAVLSKNFSAAFEITDTIYKNGWNFIDFSDGLIEHFRNITTVIVSKNSNLIETADQYKTMYMNYENSFSEGDLLRILNFLTRTVQELRFSQNHKLKLEVAILHIIGLEKTETISNLLNKIDKNPDANEFSTKKVETKAKPVSANEIKTEERVILPPKEKVDRISEKIPESLFSFKNVMENWENFVDSIKHEKSLVFGPILSQISPIGLERNEINVTIRDDAGRIIFEQKQNQEYLSRKTIEFFGKKLSFKIIEPSPSQILENEITTEQNRQPISRPIRKKAAENPLVKTIIEELGGEEIY